MITVSARSGEEYDVVVAADSTTTHQVTLRERDYERLTNGDVSPETLIEKSFEFLLERESNTMILTSFDLMVIGKYFPEYTREIGERL